MARLMYLASFLSSALAATYVWPGSCEGAGLSMSHPRQVTSLMTIELVTCHQAFYHLSSVGLSVCPHLTIKGLNNTNRPQTMKIVFDTLKNGKEGSRLLSNEAACICAWSGQVDGDASAACTWYERRGKK